MLLFRPVGLAELTLLAAADMRAFPPRLPAQPIFYPVLNQDYARQIARDWNTREEGRAGFVTRFRVDDGFAARYPVQVVGGRQHQELWVPAEELAAFNARIEGEVEVVEAYFGDGWSARVEDRVGTARLFVDLAARAQAGGAAALARQLRTAAGELP